MPQDLESGERPVLPCTTKIIMQFSSLVRRCFTLAFTLVAVGSVSGTGCSSEDPVDDRGCADSDCSGTDRCVQQECRAPCESQDDCPVTQNCAVWEFASGEIEQRCVTLPYAENGSTGHSEACQADDQCDEPRGYRCLGGQCRRQAGLFDDCESDDDCNGAAGYSCAGEQCRFRCASHFDCAGVGRCTDYPEGTFCAADDAISKGRYYTSCPNGPADCDMAADFICLGFGEADLDAYCTSDCAEDDDCPDGFRCGTASATPCQDACGEAGDATAPGCIPSSEIGEGRRYRCGTLGLVRPICVRKGFCSPCESDVDCLGTPGQICARDASGDKICTVTCAPGARSCPWGNAAECAVFDEELGVPTCSHRFGACQGSGLGCEPCVGESDCPNGFCARSSFTQEQYCIDLTTSCDCGDDADASGTCKGHGCPDSPGGPALTCLGVERFDGDPFAGRCLGAQTSTSFLGGSPQTGCWTK
jgi:hypothetical protein